MTDNLCKDKKQARKDAGKVEERKAEGKPFFTCKKCGLESHKEAHLCKPERG